MCCTGMDHRWMMPLPILYRLMRYLLGPIAVPMRRELSKNAELLVLRPENTVMRRQISPVRYTSADCTWLAALATDKPAQCRDIRARASEANPRGRHVGRRQAHRRVSCRNRAQHCTSRDRCAVSWASWTTPGSVLSWLTSTQDRDRHSFANANATRATTIDQLPSEVASVCPGQWR
jgi:hypothetical protein